MAREATVQLEKKRDEACAVETKLVEELKCKLFLRTIHLLLQ